MNAVTHTHKHLLHIHWEKPTRLFIRYAVLLALRLTVLAWALILLFEDADQLSISPHFGPTRGFTLPNVVFVLMVADMATKLLPKAHIAVGSLKQYRRLHVPTTQTIGGGKDEFIERVRELIPHDSASLDKIFGVLERGRSRSRELRDRSRTVIDETYMGLRDGAQQLLREMDVLRLLPFSDEDLTASAKMRARIRSDRLHETIPVLLFWIIFNGGAALCLHWLNILNERTILLWTLFYFVFDMVCVVLWCPLQLLMMRNRCCTTCQIFNWDAAMYTTPLLFLGLKWFSGLLLGLALIVLVRWELAFLRHPERFDERTNASLRCSNCTDRLCYLRGSLRPDTTLNTVQAQDGAKA